MSYESFRADMAFRLSGTHTWEQVTEILSVMDSVSEGWSFSPKSTSIILYEGVPDAVKLFIASKSIENRKKRTLENYYATLRDFFEIVRRPVDQVTTNDIRLFLDWYRKNRKVSNATLNGKRVVLNGFYDWCIDEELAKKNPCRRIMPIRQSDPERLPMTAIELEKVRENCETLREKALVDFLYSTAARVSEFCALNRDDVSFIDHTVHIEHGKGDKGRTTYLNAEAEVSLKAYLDSRTDDNKALFVSGKKPHNRLTIKAVQVEVQKIVRRCNLKIHVTPHIFRHTAASLALQRGMPIDQVQKFLGHAKISTTQLYAKTLDLDVKLSHQRCVA